jgi:hypothetical protein
LQFTACQKPAHDEEEEPAADDAHGPDGATIQKGKVIHIQVEETRNQFGGLLYRFLKPSDIQNVSWERSLSTVAGWGPGAFTKS